MPHSAASGQCNFCQSDLPSQLDTWMPGDATNQARPLNDLPAAAPYGHYQLLRQAGQGGMGIVYQAYDAALQRPVALKVLQLQRQGQFHQQQLLEEARVASSLQHPNIVTVYDISRSEQQSYIVTEWLEGQTLEQYLKRPLSLPDKLHLLEQIAAGLAGAHQAGVIHRDLKPSNLMVCLPSQQVKILDFGMASRQLRLQQQAETEGAGLPPMLASQLNTQWSQHTTAHQIKGTLPYLAPELLQSDVDATIQSDVFAFGVIMYELCYGVHPFLRENADATMQAIVQQIKQPPGQPAVLPQSLKNLINQCLASHPSQRPADLSKVAVFLAKLRQELLQRQRLGIWYPLVRWQFWAAIAPMILIFSLWLGQQSVDKQSLLSQGKTLALLPLQNIGADPSVQQFLTGMSLSLSQDLAQIGQHNGNVWVLPPAELAQLKEVSAKAIYQQFQTELVINGSLQHLGNIRRLSLNLQNGADGRILKSTEVDLALDNWDLAQQQVRTSLVRLLNWQLPDALSLSKGSATNDTAYKAYLTGISYLYRHDYKDNIEKSLQQLQLAVQTDAEFIEARYALIEAMLQTARVRDIHHWLPQAERLTNELVQQLPKNSRLLALQAEIAKLRSDYPRAIDLFSQALQLEPGNAMLIHGQARAFDLAGQTAAAERQFQQAAEISRNWYFINTLAVFYYQHQQLDKAERSYRELAGLAPNNAQVLQTLGAIQFSRGDYPAALTTFKQAVAIANDAVNHSNIGTLLFYQQKYFEASEHFAMAVELKPDNYQLWGNLADSYRWAQQPNKARESYQQAIRLVSLLLEKTPKLQNARLRLGLYLAKNGQSRQALQELMAAGTLKKAQQLINAAQICEISGERQRAVDYLQAALALGYDFASLQSEPEFRQLLQQQMLTRPEGNKPASII
ncbi:MAG: protein kinase [Rheinheimera sp.]|nr:protein kinase [Rheinheimera sp.]